MRFIVDSYKRENIVQDCRYYIAVNLRKLRDDRTIFSLFLEIVKRNDLSVETNLLEKIHLRMAEYAFRSYTKQRNNNEFNKIKALASDKTNLSF